MYPATLVAGFNPFLFTVPSFIYFHLITAHQELCYNIGYCLTSLVGLSYSPFCRVSVLTMTTATRLDLLILYNGNTARSATSKSKQPFPLKSINNPCNVAYSYFLEYCERIGLSAGFTTSKDIIGPGLCSSYWIYRHKKWHKVNEPCQSNVVYDKFSPQRIDDVTLQSLFFSKRSVKKYNSKKVSAIFFDKQKTHSSLLTHTIPTAKINTLSVVDIKSALSLLTNLTLSTNPGDFSNGFILKDRYGAGGWHVYKIEGDNKHKQIQKIVRKNKDTSFILQPFALFDRGYSYQDELTTADIRLIYLDGQLFHSYLRFPKTGDFRCNEHQGGSSVYIRENEIPLDIRVKADAISSSLKTTSLIALDFIVTNAGTPYLIEGNTGPGLSWNENINKEVYMGKKLIRGIVDQLASRMRVSKTRSINHSPHPILYAPKTLPTLQSV